MQSDVIVTVCTTANLRAAQALISDSAESDRSSSIPTTKFADLDPQNILVAAVDGRVVGAIHHQLGVGQVAWMWPPALDEDACTSLAARQVRCGLVMAGVERLAKQGARLIQILLQPDDCRGDVLVECGFHPVTQIVQMERGVAGTTDLASALSAEFVPFSESLTNDLCAVVEQTYKQSLDCPELDGVRPVSDVLDGYRAAGEFRNGLWCLVRSEGEFVGCVLLCSFPESSIASLQYMGVIPRSRRRGIARQMTRHAIRTARAAGAQIINLAVDVRNVPAWRLYRELGFCETERRSVFIMRVDPSRARC
jgi:ribosomal protein S18 acetylase RimI-like enzyme